MSDIALITDIHVGVKNDDKWLMDYQLDFFKNQFFPDIKKRKIKTVVCLGDLFDRRKYSNHDTVTKWAEEVFDWFEQNKITFHVIIGNHDVFYKNTLKVNSPTLLLNTYKYIKIYDEPMDVVIDGEPYAFFPWVCDSTYQQTIKHVEDSHATVAFGHFEFSGFEMYRGQVMEHGSIDRELFKKFSIVCSGHYHHRSNNNHIYYLGNPFEFTWADYDDPRGYTIFSPNTKTLEFVQNKKTMFNKVFYDDKDKDAQYWKTIKVSDYVGKFVKLVVLHKTDSYQFDMLQDAFAGIETADLKVIEDYVDIGVDVETDELKIEDSYSLLDKMIDVIEFDGNKKKLKNMMKSLFVECQVGNND